MWGRTTISKEDLIYMALLPGADGLPFFRLPGTFDPDDPTQYHRKVQLPLLMRKFERVSWGLTHAQKGQTFMGTLGGQKPERAQTQQINIMNTTIAIRTTTRITT